MSSEVQQGYDELVRSHVWPRLKEAGFKRSKTTFHRPVGANWEVVNLQKSAYSDSAHIRFTINVGVAIERLRTGMWDWGEGKRPRFALCRFQRRLGELMTGEDVWWDVTPETDVASLADAVGEAIERYGLPWLRDRSSDEALRDTLLADPDSAYDHELGFVAELVEQIGPRSALAALKRELEQRAGEASEQ